MKNDKKASSNKAEKQLTVADLHNVSGGGLRWVLERPSTEDRIWGKEEGYRVEDFAEAGR